MKRIAKTLICCAILSITSNLTAFGQNSDFNPITQYRLVDVSDFGPFLRDRDNLGNILKSIGFNVRTFDRPQSMDEMDDFTEIVATRKGNGASTRLHFKSGEDRLITIDFANKDELNDFIDSMNKSGYSKEGTLYSHPSNVAGMGMIYVRINGLKAKIINSFEMLPANF